MDISDSKIETNLFTEAKDLTTNIENPKYNLSQYTLASTAANTPLFRVDVPVLSLLVIAGRLTVLNANGDPSTAFTVEKEEGLHLFQGSCFQLRSDTPETTLLIAAERTVRLTPIAAAEGAGLEAVPVSGYRVSKPWGWERWYTQNIADGLPYALKLIYMDKGFQSSLQSHVKKSETNLVIEGRAKVLFGREAPSDITAQIDLSTLESKIYSAGEGWSNKVMELHRVIAHESYKAVEISTPELDDVIRWQDDTQRQHGHIQAEHQGSQV